MALSDAGVRYIVTAINSATTAGFVPFTSVNSYIGLGTSNTAQSSATTCLKGDTVAFSSMAATYPTISSNVMTFQATFSTSNPNTASFAVEEWGIFNAASTASGTMLSRATTSLGTKTTTASWVVTATLTWDVGS